MQTNRGSIRVPRYLAPLARKLRAIEKIVYQKDTGLIIDSPTIKNERQPTGRVHVKLVGN